MATFEVRSTTGESRITFVGPGPRIVATVYGRDLTATTWLSEESDYADIQPDPTVKEFFADLANRWMDDASSIAYRSPDGQLEMRCEWDGRGHFCLRVALASIPAPDEALWKVETTVHLETSMLPGLSAAANDAL